jgi:hypothetical protein
VLEMARQAAVVRHKKQGAAGALALLEQQLHEAVAPALVER